MRLFLCEKPSQARDIAKFISASQRGEGFLSGTGVIVTWARGHLLEQAEPGAYGEQYGNPWRMEVLPLIPPQWKLEVKKEARAQFAVINRLLKQVDEVVIATDADREGEVIARELLEYCRFQGRVYRLWLSALDDASIRAALADICPYRFFAAVLVSTSVRQTKWARYPANPWSISPLLNWLNVRSNRVHGHSVNRLKEKSSWLQEDLTR